ncbi:MAG: hypothetical protein KDE04_10465, partial [Anaerolineales bacterium]|nr:hypothetical protein [Anaerolineales bacterium]
SPPTRRVPTNPTGPHQPDRSGIIEVMCAQEPEIAPGEEPKTPVPAAEPAEISAPKGQPALEPVDELVEPEELSAHIRTVVADLDADPEGDAASTYVRRPADRGFVFALFFFVGAIFLGSLLTSLPALHSHNWFFWVGLRLLVQIGGGLWFGYALADMMELGRWQIALVFLLFGAVISMNALLDAVQGPQPVEGTVAAYVPETNYLHDSFGWQLGLRAQIELESSDGHFMVLTPAGAQVPRWRETVRRCRESDLPIQFLMLTRLEIILDAHCFQSA